MERSVFSLFPWGKKIDNEKEDKKRKSKVIIFSTPIESMADMINRIIEVDLEKRVESKNDYAEKFIQLADLLEKEILHGKLSLNLLETKEKELVFKTLDNIWLEAKISSSMVKDLSFLVLYLRYVAQPGDWLVIDEPEMNLHPEAQVKLMEFLALLTSCKLKVLITTHSPYMVDHLTNLMKAAESNEKETIKKKFYLKETDSFINKNDVSIYFFNNGRVNNILRKDGLINWSTFGKISDKINNLYFEI